MPRLRAVAGVVGLILVLLLAIVLVGSLADFYARIALTAPWLANSVLVAILVGLLGALGLGAYSLFSRRGGRKRRQQTRRTIPTTKAGAVAATLEAVGSRLEDLQDGRLQALIRARVGEIATQLARQEWQIAVFGTGSAGKTSLINALMGQMVGEVGAPMGTTTAGATYALDLVGLERRILITDTPGILEASSAGSQRAEAARKLACAADLLLFVVDNDLHRSEWEPLLQLAALGKRSLLVFNKIDLYPAEERAAILQGLRQRVAETIAPGDVVAIAANPQPVALAEGGLARPSPKVLPLIRRLAAILRADGEILVADNVLLQAQQLDTETRALLDRQRLAQAERLVARYQWIGAGVIAATPLPVVDMIATAAINAQMVRELGRIYGCDLDWERARELARSLGKTMIGLGIVKSAIRVLATALELSVAAYLAGKAIQAVVAAYLTRIAGKSFIEYFRHDRDWGDGGMAEVVKEQFRQEQQEEFLKRFLKEAIARAIAPSPAERAREETPSEDRQSPP